MPAKRLPAELYAIIFEFACTRELESDTRCYRTACSLCFVSRYVYSIVVPIMYGTILIDGRTKTLLLSRTLRSRPDLGCLVQCLLISDHARRPQSPADDDTLEVPPSFAFDFPLSQEARIENRQRMGMWLTKRAETLTSFHCAVSHILSVVSTRLKVLSICLYGHYNDKIGNGLVDALSWPFPTLVDLTIRDNVQPWPCARLELPMLEHLHLAGGNPPFPFTSLEAHGTGCPRLTDIRLSEPLIDDEVVSLLESLFSVHPGSDRTMKTLKRPPRVTLKPSFPSTGALSNGPFERLDRLSSCSEHLEVVWSPPLFVRGNAKREIRYPLDEAIRDWIDSIKKRPGVWQTWSSAPSTVSNTRL